MGKVGQPECGSAKSLMETLVMYKLGSMKFAAQNIFIGNINANVQ